LKLLLDGRNAVVDLVLNVSKAGEIRAGRLHV
jgi:hypothetical protein